MSQKYDVNEPILVLVRRGRKGRGFTVCPVEDASNPAVCTDSKDMGEVIEEFLNDPSQPRVNVKDLLGSVTSEDSSPSSTSKSDANDSHRNSSHADGDKGDSDKEEDDEEDDDEEDEGGILSGVAGSEDPASQLLVNLLSSAISQGRKMSSTKVRARGRRSKRRKSS